MNSVKAGGCVGEKSLFILNIGDWGGSMKVIGKEHSDYLSKKGNGRRGKGVGGTFQESKDIEANEDSLLRMKGVIKKGMDTHN